MIIKIFLIVPLLTVVFYTLAGIMKREVWIAGRPPGLGAVKLKGSRASFFGFSFSVIYIFLIFYFISEMQLEMEYVDWAATIILGVCCAWFITFLEKVTISNPFRWVIPALVVIIGIIGLVNLYFVIQS